MIIIQTIDFIKECSPFFVLTAKDDCPIGRPFGAIMEYNSNLYISTADTKNVYDQMTNNPNVQIIALKNGTRSWIRIAGKAEECKDITVKQKMLDECPVLKNHFPTADAPHYSVFKIIIKHTDIY